MPPQTYRSAHSDHSSQQREDWLRRLTENVAVSQARADTAVAQTNLWSSQQDSSMAACAATVFEHTALRSDAVEPHPILSSEHSDFPTTNQDFSQTDAHSTIQPYQSQDMPVVQNPAPFLGDPDVHLFSSEGDSLPAHRQFLKAASAKLAQDLQELDDEPTSEGPLRLTLPCSTSVLITLLGFAYPGASGVQLLSAPIKTVEDVVLAAHDLQVAGVKEFVDALLRSRPIDAESARHVCTMGILCDIPQWVQLAKGLISPQDVHALAQGLAEQDKYKEAYAMLSQYFHVA